MSYCRWSSDNWKCDLYCYECADGVFVTHVASLKIEGDIPEEPNILDVPLGKWQKAHDEQMDFLDNAKMVAIGLEYDGENFNDSNLKSFLRRLYHLKETGYNFPDRVINMVKEEIKIQDEE